MLTNHTFSLLIKPKFVDPKGIEPSTLSLQGRNASLGTCKPIIFVGEEGFEPPAFLMYRIYSPTPIRHLSSSPNCPSQTSFYEEKKMVDRLLCYSEHFCIINVRFSFLSSKQDSNLRSPHPKCGALTNSATTRLQYVPDSNRRPPQ